MNFFTFQAVLSLSPLLTSLAHGSALLVHRDEVPTYVLEHGIVKISEPSDATKPNYLEVMLLETTDQNLRFICSSTFTSLTATQPTANFFLDCRGSPIIAQVVLSEDPRETEMIFGPLGQPLAMAKLPYTTWGSQVLDPATEYHLYGTSDAVTYTADPTVRFQTNSTSEPVVSVNVKS